MFSFVLFRLSQDGHLRFAGFRGAPRKNYVSQLDLRPRGIEGFDSRVPASTSGDGRHRPVSQRGQIHRARLRGLWGQILRHLIDTALLCNISNKEKK